MKLIITILFGLLICGFVFAQNPSAMNPVLCESFGECFDRIVTVLFYFSIGIVSLSIIIAGALFLTGGTPARLSLAKKVVLWGIGIFVIMLLVKIISFISKDDLTTLK